MRMPLVLVLPSASTAEPPAPDAGAPETVQIEVDGTRLCANDRVRAYDPVEAKGVGSRAFARCRLGAFTPIASR